MDATRYQSIKMHDEGSLSHTRILKYKMDNLLQRRINWHISEKTLAIYLCLMVLLVILVRRLLSRAQIRWYHAPATVNLNLKFRGQVDLAQLCKSVTPPCYLNPLLCNRHLQTLFFMFDNRSYPLYFRRMIFDSHDPQYQGTFAVDFTSTPFETEDPDLPGRTAYMSDKIRQELGSDDSRPMVLALHGLCGGSHEQYLQHVLAPLVTGKQKWEACVVLSRGCGQSSITGGGMYIAHATSDVRQVVAWLRKTFPNRPLYAVGFSMGANILTRYIAEEGEDCAFKAAVVVSNPWNLELTAMHLQRTFLGRWLYSPAMTSSLMDVFSQNAEKIETVDGDSLDMEPTSKVRLMHEYDRYIQCPTWGFPTERVYYRQASSSDSVLEVRIPFWAINAEDDPVVGSESIPKGEFQISPYTIMCTTDGGGHLGWFQPDGTRWYARAIVSFLQEMQTAE